MSIIKRAGLYCLRQRFRTVILFLVLMIIATFMITGIAVRDAAKGATADVQTAIGGKIMLNLEEGRYGSGQQNEWGTRGLCVTCRPLTVEHPHLRMFLKR